MTDVTITIIADPEVDLEEVKEEIRKRFCVFFGLEYIPEDKYKTEW